MYADSRDLKSFLSRLMFLREYASSLVCTEHSEPSTVSALARRESSGYSMYFIVVECCGDRDERGGIGRRVCVGPLVAGVGVGRGNVRHFVNNESCLFKTGGWANSKCRPLYNPNRNKVGQSRTL